jgi:hypothetical protein
MASRATKLTPSVEDLLPPLPPEGPELDALIREMVAEADADPRPSVPMAAAFARIRANIAKNG